MAEKILQSSPAKSVKKINIPIQHSQLLDALPVVIESPTLGRVFAEIILQCLWAMRTKSKADQIALARKLGEALDSYAVNQKGGAA